MDSIDRIIRFIVAIVLISIVVFGAVRGTLGLFIVLLSIVFFITSVSGFCPFYKSINVDFNKSKD